MMGVKNHLAILTLTLCGAPFTAGLNAQGTKPAAPELSSQQQMAELLREKENRTPAQQKIDSQLVYAIKAARREPLGPNVPSLATDIQTDAKGRTIVDITARDLKQVAAALEGLPDAVALDASGHNLRVRARLEQLETIAAWPEVVFVNPAQDARLQQVEAGIAPPPPRARKSRRGRRKPPSATHL